MPVLPDSDSYYDEERQLSQLQALLQIIRHELERATSADFKWLDLGCGRGQVLAQLTDNIDAAHIARISYFGIDGNQVHTDHARIKALSIGMKSASCHCSLLEDLAAVLTEERGFNLATLTNTFHELDPLVVPDLLVDVLGRLDAEGSLFVYDMRTLEKSELGAITWGHDEIQRLVNAWCETLKSRSRPPKVARWRHARVEGWSFELRRDSLAITNADLPTARGELLRQLSIALNLKLQDTMALLNALTNPGIKTPEEDAIKTRELYNFWGLTYRTGRSQ